MDFTGLMYAIASLSASFVAILGGLLVSRLITINGDRSSYSREPLAKVDTVDSSLSRSSQF